MWCMKIYGTVLSGAIGMAVVACTPFQQQTIDDLLPPPEKAAEASTKKPEADEVKEKEDKEEAQVQKKEERTEETGAVTPTPEQQAAAEKLLAEDTAGSTNAPEEQETTPTQTDNEGTMQDTEVLPPSIPGRNALRMGQYAPPEEAASVNEAASFHPNSAEQHGFRSPMLPTALPMDIHGKLTGEEKN